MRSSCSVIIRFIIGILNLIFGILFITLGVVGVLLRTNKDFLIKFTNTFAKEFLSGISEDDIKGVANFILENDVQTSVFFIVVGFVIGFICIIGFVATCCSCSKLIKIYALILTTAIIIQAVIVGIVFGIPHMYLSVVDTSLENGLKHYNPDTEQGKVAANLWDLVMSAENETCCGMDGAADFENSAYAPKCPVFCCKSRSNCTCEEAKKLTPPVPGCREKVEKTSKIYVHKVLTILICVIVAQGILAILTYAALTCKTSSPI